MEEIIVAIIGGLSVSIPTLVKIRQENSKKTQAYKDELERINKRLNEIDKSACKNFLVRFLRDVERGEKLDEVEVERAHETFNHYTEVCEGNGYIKRKWNKLMK